MDDIYKQEKGKVVILEGDELAAHLSGKRTAEEIESEDWQKEMLAHDAKWTPRMDEDQANINLGLVTVQELRDTANVDQIPLEWWIEEKARIRDEKS